MLNRGTFAPVLLARRCSVNVALEEFMIIPDGVKRKMDGVVDSVSPDKGCEVLDGELTHK